MITGISEQEQRTIMSDLFGEVVERMSLRDIHGTWLPGTKFYDERRTYEAKLRGMAMGQEAESAVMPNYYKQGVDFMTNRPIFRRYESSSEDNPLIRLEIFSYFFRVPIDKATHVLV